MLKKVGAQILRLLAWEKFPEGPLDFSAEEKEKIDQVAKGLADKYMKEHNAQLESDESNELIANYMAEGTEAFEEGEEQEDTLVTTDASLSENVATLIKSNKEQKAKIQELNAQMEKLKVLPDADQGEKITGTMNKNTYQHSDTHLFGIQESWNEIEGRSWNKAAKQASLGQKITAETNWTNTANIEKLNSDIQNYFRKDAKMLKPTLLDGLTLKKYVQTISGVSDEYIFTTIATGEITQSLKSKYLPKNKVKFEAEKGKVRDIQIDMLFKGFELKKLEKSYLKNFQNMGINDSNPYKETFVRFVVMEIMKRARKEDKIVIGKGVYYNDPERDTPASFMNNFDGFYKLIDTARQLGKYLPFRIGKPTPINIKEYLKNMCERLPHDIKVLPDLQFVCSPYWKRKYNESRRITEGNVITYEGNVDYVQDFPNIEIVTDDSLEGSDFMYITTKDNEYILTDKPGEDGFIQFEKDTRDIKAFGDYKLGAFIAVFGRKQIDGSKGYDNQLFFSNDAELVTDSYIPVPANATTPSLKVHHSLVIGSNNTAATDITGFSDAIPGKKVYLLGNTDANPSTVKNNDNIILKDGDFTLKNGNLLVLNALPGGKFIEVSRKVVTEDQDVVKIALAPNADTIDAVEGTHFVTAANTDSDVEITDIDNAIVGEKYTIEGGSDQNPTKINSGGIFFISGEIELANGKFITLEYTGTEFIEVNRG